MNGGSGHVGNGDGGGSSGSGGGGVEEAAPMCMGPSCAHTPLRLHARVLQPTTKSYLIIQIYHAPSTWVLARGAERHRLSGSLGLLDKIFGPHGAHGDHTHVHRVRVVRIRWDL